MGIHDFSLAARQALENLLSVHKTLRLHSVVAG